MQPPLGNVSSFLGIWEVQCSQWVSWDETEMVRCSDSDDPSEKLELHIHVAGFCTRVPINKFENSQGDYGSNVGVALLVPVKKWVCFSMLFLGMLTENQPQITRLQ